MQSLTPFAKLNGTNYKTWSTYMDSLLLTRYLDLWKIIHGHTPKPKTPESSAEFVDWKIKSSQAIAHLLLHSESSLHATISSSTDASVAWNSLKSSLMPRGLGARVTELRRLYNMSKAPDQSMRDWCAAVRSQASVLSDLDVTLRADEIFVTLTRGVGDRYDAVIVQLSALEDDKRSIDIIIQALVDQESRVGEPEPDPSASAYAVRSKFNMDNIECHNCHQRGHFANKCPQSVKGGQDRLTNAVEELTIALRDFKSPSTSAMFATISDAEADSLEFSGSPHVF
jgi:hypothetical protein